MLRTTSAALAALFITTVGASAQTAFPFWIGSAVIDSATGCANAFIQKNDILESAYRAKTGIAGEPTNPGINFYQARSTMSYFRFSGADANTMNGDGAGKGYLIRGNVTTIPTPTTVTYDMTFSFKVTPTTIKKTTQNITIDGTITNWRDVAGCMVTFRASYRLGNWK